MKIIFATGNENKLREIREIMGDLTEEILSMKEAGVAADPEENGSSFEENAAIKATACAELATGKYAEDVVVMADDSGLEIDALGGEPGIYSARYLGHDTSYDEKNRIILERLKDVPEEDRGARFVCAVAAVVLPAGKPAAEAGEPLITRETMEGRIAHEIAGANGFGYDPIFLLPEYGRTSAEISPDEKNAISHRGKALRAMREKLREELA
ncbi:MAG: RdgB/HAM1 family non-canonical purine NTP pyrophosphatase [Lachnospiraceae bacterium]|nr:RdgB/HAM1 family non-canonical purine NTP pyrophosphatase [Lachnospiraceae bacterium]